MDIYQLMNTHAVKVNGGSGVLVSALSHDYSYVLTAGHVIRDHQKHEILNYRGDKIDAIQTYSHPDIDCAVIKVPYEAAINLELHIGEIPHEASLMMVGYPDTRNNETDFDKKVKQQSASFSSFIEDEIVIRATEGVDREMIEGFSGAGVYYVGEGYPRLIGIEYSMDGPESEWYLGNLKCNAIRCYEELIETNSLKPIRPSFLECFSRLRDKTFNYDVPGTKVISHIKEEFGGIIDEILEDELVKPNLILNKYKAALLFPEKQHSSLLDIKLWISYLEFMTISVLLDDPTKADSDYFSGLDKKRRMVFSNSEKNWIYDLRGLFKIADSMLDEGGVLVIDNYEPSPTVIPAEFQMESVLQNISRPKVTGSRLKINQGSVSKYNSFKFAHIRALHRRCLIERIDELHNAEPSEYLNMLREFYNVYVN